jgi:Fe-S cluster biogenesis protein NfuA
MEDLIKKILKEKVDPILEMHYGGAELTKYEDNVAYVRLTGSCATCPSAQQTIEDVVTAVLMDNVEGIQGVVLDDSVSDELIELAKQFLNKSEVE